MAYEWEEIRSSQEIFYYLLEHHQLREEDEPRLYQAYTQQEEIQNLVKSQGEIAMDGDFRSRATRMSLAPPRPP